MTEYNRMLALLETEPTFLDMVVALGSTELVTWWLAYLAKHYDECEGVQIEPVDPTLEEKWLIKAWDYEFFAKKETFDPSYAKWCNIRWRITDEWKDRLEEIPKWSNFYKPPR